MPETTMSFQAKATTTGHSKALRIDAALYQTHPEFASGKFEIDVIAPGRMLVRSQATTEAPAEHDPIFSVFLDFIGQQIAQAPHTVTIMDADEMARVAELVAGITVDPDDVFPDDFELP